MIPSSRIFSGSVSNIYPATQPARMLSTLLIIVLPLLLHAPALLGLVSEDPRQSYSSLNMHEAASVLLPGQPGWVDGNSGVTTQALGRDAARQWLHGHVPWWDSFNGLGLPLAAEAQNSALFVPFICLLALPNGLLWLKCTIQILAGLCMYGMALSLGLGEAVCAVMAIATSFCGTLAWFAHGPIMPVPFLPLLIWGGVRVCRHVAAGRSGGWRMISIALAGSLYAGFPETAFLDGILALVILGSCIMMLPGILRWGAIRRIIIAGLVGLALAAPAYLPFIAYLPLAELGQNTDFGDAHFMPGSWAMQLFPTLFGPPQFGFFSHVPGDTTSLWWHTGGYVDLVLCTLALAGLLRANRSGPYRGLRLALGVWLVLTLAKAGGVRPVSRMIDLIPMIHQTMFYVLSAPAWSIAMIILAGLALDDLRQRGALSRSKAKFILAVAAIAGGFAVYDARSQISLLLMARHMHLLLALSLLWTGGMTVALIIALARARRGINAGRLFIANVIVLAAFPLTAAYRSVPLDISLITWAQTHVGLNRMITMRIMDANYSAFYGIRSINFNMLPVAGRFVHSFDTHVDTHQDSISYSAHGFGTANGQNVDLSSVDTYRSGFVSALDAKLWLAQQGVAYAAFRNEQLPMHDIMATISNHGATTICSWRDVLHDGTLQLPIYTPTSIRRIGIALGTYFGHVDGSLTLRVCAAGQCRAVQKPMSEAGDMRFTWMDLPQVLPVPAQTSVDWTVELHDSQMNPAVIAAQDNPGVPAIALEFEDTMPDAPVVYRDSLATILALPNAAPYFSANNCTVQPISGLEADISCRAASTLVRREFMMDSWKAWIDGRAVPVSGSAHDLFQHVAVPAGRNRVTFAYEPPHYRLLTILFWIGVVALVPIWALWRHPLQAWRKG